MFCSLAPRFCQAQQLLRVSHSIPLRKDTKVKRAEALQDEYMTRSSTRAPTGIPTNPTSVKYYKKQFCLRTYQRDVLKSDKSMIYNGLQQPF